MDLLDAPPGRRLRVVALTGDVDLRLRLAELGIRPGERLAVSRRTSGGGRVVEVDYTRIALDRGTAGGITVDVLTEPTA